MQVEYSPNHRIYRAHMPQNSLTIEASDGTSLFLNVWPGKKGTGRKLLILHGMGEHSGRYSHVPQLLCDEFEEFYAMDQRGHGRSGGTRGHASSFDELVTDLLRVAHSINAKNSTPLFLLAHSMGGLVALKLLLKEKAVPFAGVILSAPLLQIALHVPTWKRAAGHVLARSLSKLQMNNEVNPAILTHDPKVVEAYMNDRLVHTKCTPRFYVSMLETMDWVLTHAWNLACPVLFLVPGQDEVVSTPKTLEFYQKLHDRRKELKQYPKMYHEVLNEIDKDQVFQDIRTWVWSLSKNRVS